MRKKGTISYLQRLKVRRIPFGDCFLRRAIKIRLEFWSKPRLWIKVILNMVLCHLLASHLHLIYQGFSLTLQSELNLLNFRSEFILLLSHARLVELLWWKRKIVLIIDLDKSCIIFCQSMLGLIVVFTHLRVKCLRRHLLHIKLKVINRLVVHPLLRGLDNYSLYIRFLFRNWRYHFSVNHQHISLFGALQQDWLFSCLWGREFRLLVEQVLCVVS